MHVKFRDPRPPAPGAGAHTVQLQAPSTYRKPRRVNAHASPHSIDCARRAPPRPPQVQSFYGSCLLFHCRGRVGATDSQLVSGGLLSLCWNCVGWGGLRAIHENELLRYGARHRPFGRRVCCDSSTGPCQHGAPSVKCGRAVLRKTPPCPAAGTQLKAAPGAPEVRKRALHAGAAALDAPDRILWTVSTWRRRRKTNPGP